MGSPQEPTPEQYAQLKAAGQLQLLTSPEWLDVSGGSVTIATAGASAGDFAAASGVVRAIRVTA